MSDDDPTQIEERIYALALRCPEDGQALILMPNGFGACTVCETLYCPRHHPEPTIGFDGNHVLCSACGVPPKHVNKKEVGH